jgi:hypothetical protein
MLFYKLHTPADMKDNANVTPKFAFKLSAYAIIKDNIESNIF